VREVAFAIPGDLSAPTGGYEYDRRMIEHLPRTGWRVRHVALPGDFPAPSAASLAATEAAIAATPTDAVLLCDGLAFGALPAALIERTHKRFVALVHLPLALETGLSPARAETLARSERDALARTAHVVTASKALAAILAHDYGVAPEHITVAEPGSDPAPRARPAPGVPRLLSVGTIAPVKGYDILIGALARVSDLQWECRIAGSLTRDPETAAALRAAIARHGLASRVHLLGALGSDALAAEYAQARLFVLASRFESYGIAAADALARGIPVVATGVGALPDTVPADAGTLVRPGDADALAAVLRELLSDPGAIERRAEAAWRHASKLPRWEETARKLAAALERVRAEVPA
jgi:glycosyltransferase involved in cell wall biosynthesis